MNLSKSKHCPFCGNTNLKIDSKSIPDGWTRLHARVNKETYYVRCNVCHAQGGAVSGKVIKSNLHLYSDHLPNWAVSPVVLMQRAIELWERRADNGE